MNLESYHKTTELLSTCGNTLREFMADTPSPSGRGLGEGAKLRSLAKTGDAINETNDHLKTLIAKFDTHSGDSAGLEYHN